MSPNSKTREPIDTQFSALLRTTNAVSWAV